MEFLGAVDKRQVTTFRYLGRNIERNGMLAGCDGCAVKVNSGHGFLL
jgi:hypothetical protein